MPGIKVKIFVMGLCAGFLGHQGLAAESWELRPMDDHVAGSQQIREGRIEEAIRLLKRALETDFQGNADILGNLCVAYAIDLDYTTALRYCSQAINRADADAMVYNNRGAVRAAIGDYRGALRDFRQAACASNCVPSCVNDEESARAIAQRNLRRLKLAYPELDREELRFQAQM